MSAGRTARVVAFWSSAVTWLSFACFALPARADEPTAPTPPTTQAGEPATARAADLYDEATRLYEAGQYAAAAEKYLDADTVVPTSEALSNAIASARKANAPLLVARAAQRAIARELLDPVLAERARVALKEVEPQLTPLESPPPQASSTEPPLRGEPAPARKQDDAPTTPPVVDASAGISPWVFWAGVGATGVLTGVTVWSGLDTLDDEDALPSQYDPNYSVAKDEVTDSATRTDWLLAATLVTAASTAALAIWAVDWGNGNTMQVGAAPTLRGATPSGATLRWWGHFQ
jgi:hypothetical protein